MRQKPRSFLRFGLLIPAPPSNMAGTIKPNAKSAPEPRWPAGVPSAACGPAVETVRMEVPVAPVTEVAPRVHVVAGFVAGVTLQVSFTVDGSSPPRPTMVTFAVDDEPGITEAGDNAAKEMLKPVTSTGRCDEVIEP